MGDELELKKKESDALLQSGLAAMAEQEKRDAADMADTKALEEAHQSEQTALADYNKQQYSNLGEIVGDIQTKIDSAKAMDEAALKRENAYRYITGVGDTLASLANLVGVAELGASNQNQTYSSHAVVKKAEEARKQRKLEMEDLNTRLDEMKARQRDIKASGSLKEAEMKARHNRESLQLATAQRKAEEDAIKRNQERGYRAARDARQDFVADRAYEMQKKSAEQSVQQWKDSYDLQVQKYNREAAEADAKNNYPLTINGEKVIIPKTELNDGQIGRIFSMIPESIRKTVVGKAFNEKTLDEYGEEKVTTKYGAPSIGQQIAAIMAYAENKGYTPKSGEHTPDQIAEEMIKLGADYKPTPLIGAKTGKDWSKRATQN